MHTLPQAYRESPRRNALRRGDLVEVRHPADIIATLDGDGTLDGLPFMPEMVPLCGQRFRVAYHVEKTCVDGYSDTFRAFDAGDVVFLDDLRCSGDYHDGCARSCRLFWKQAWLQKVDDDDVPPRAVSDAARMVLRSRLKTRNGKKIYFCQSTALMGATEPLPRAERLFKIVEDVQLGNRSVGEAIRQVSAALAVKLHSRLFGKWPVGALASTPTESLGLKPGDQVEVKSIEEIRATLDASGKNRGLRFTNEMDAFCGNQYVVQRVLDRMILEHTGEMVTVRNSVILDNVHCRCTFAIGGCHRAENSYWREIWLRRIAKSE